jgi:hypothetical protein
MNGSCTSVTLRPLRAASRMTSLSCSNRSPIADLQREFATHVEDRRVANLERTGSEFLVTQQTGERVDIRQVVAAIRHDMPRILARLDPLPLYQITRTRGHKNSDSFSGKDLIVVGDGSSAPRTDVRANAHAKIAARSEVHLALRGLLEWERGLIDRIRVPIIYSATWGETGCCSACCGSCTTCHEQAPADFTSPLGHCQSGGSVTERKGGFRSTSTRLSSMQGSKVDACT